MYVNRHRIPGIDVGGNCAILDCTISIDAFCAVADSVIGRASIEKAATQMANNEKVFGKFDKHAVVLYQNTPNADETYMRNQINKFFTKSPKNTREMVDVVIVVGAIGHVHRHFKEKK